MSNWHFFYNFITSHHASLGNFTLIIFVIESRGYSKLSKRKLASKIIIKNLNKDCSIVRYANYICSSIRKY